MLTPLESMELLLNSSIWPIAGAVVTNLAVVDRTHNGIQLFNECLAVQQLSYITFYGTLWVIDAPSWSTTLLFFLMGLSMTLAAIALYGVRSQGKKVKKDHACPVHDDNCPTDLSSATRKKILSLNLILNIVAFLVFLFLVILPLATGIHI